MCRLWNKPWGLPKISRTRKANRKAANKITAQNEALLKEAAAKDPKYFAASAEGKQASQSS